MVAKIKDITIIGLFLLVIFQTFTGKKPCPELPEIKTDTVRITHVDTLYLPADTVWKQVTIHKPVPGTQRPAPEPVPQVISTYSDSIVLGDCEVAYEALVLGQLMNLNLKARRTSSRVVRITDTQYITREVEKKVYPNRLYIGGGVGGNKQMIDDISASVMFANKRNAYALDYDFIDETIRAKIYFKIF